MAVYQNDRYAGRVAANAKTEQCDHHGELNPALRRTSVSPRLTGKPTPPKRVKFEITGELRLANPVVRDCRLLCSMPLVFNMNAGIQFTILERLERSFEKSTDKTF